jgi:hypothetical protein
MEIEEFKQYFEESLQDLNSKLNIFADKIKDIDRLTVK